jgi:hypothetical protein
MSTLRLGFGLVMFTLYLEVFGFLPLSSYIYYYIYIHVKCQGCSTWTFETFNTVKYAFNAIRRIHTNTPCECRRIVPPESYGNKCSVPFASCAGAQVKKY